jgi:lipopolysaccharide/colanic/teichoic acid biosynthesis glycosyltransferase
MGLIAATIGAVLTIVGIVASRLLADECKAWTPWLIDRLIKNAVRRLSLDQRDRYTEEWLSHVNEVPGQIGKVVVAFGFLKASWKMAPDLSQDLPFAAIKRMIDLCICTAALILFAPLLLLFAVLIKLETPGPVFFRSSYKGYGSNTLTLFKFRTLSILDGEPRITRLGRFLRRTNIDELPQLFNVLSGELSIVGPRQRLPDSSGQPKHETEKFKAKPGITGWAQLHSHRDGTPLQQEQRAAFDAWYAEHRSILLDLKIILLTVVVSWRRKGNQRQAFNKRNIGEPISRFLRKFLGP